MTSYAWARAESADAPVAVLMPGANYSVQAPLLYWCATLLAQRGWHVQAVDWTVDDDARAHPLPFVEQAVAEAFVAGPPNPRRLVVAKSFGTWALPWARREGIPGVWLTPLLTEQPVSEALRAATSADLAIGGEADAFWLPDRAGPTDARLISVPGAGHALTLPGDWRGSVDLQSGILAQVAAHLGDR
jgi:pimeloyl-ACP methyl ester carboxylesterase